MSQSIAASILQRDRLPAMPTVVMRVLELCGDDEVNLREIASALESDPVLVAKILRVANSPLYAVGPVLSVEQAIGILGLRAVKVTVLGFALVETVRGQWQAGTDYPHYWRRSISTGVAARRMASLVGRLRSEEAFLGGLLADIGLVAVQTHPSGAYAEVLKEGTKTGEPLTAVEKRILGASHAAISAEMLRRWHMPPILCDAVCAHHGDGIESLEPRTKLLASVLWAAAEVGDLFADTREPEKVEQVRQHAADLAGLDRESIDSLIEDLNGQVRELADTFDVGLSSEVSYGGIREQAVDELVTLSASAEKERQTDALTGLPNHGAFEERALRSLQDVAGRGEAFGLMLLDIDHFKKLNDRLGHQGGDVALQEMGECLRRVCAERTGCFAARYGGEEFTVAVPDISMPELQRMADSLRTEISKIRADFEGHKITFTASIGVVHARPTRSSQGALREIVGAAEAALYEAKTAGRNCTRMSQGTERPAEGPARPTKGS